MFDLFFPNAEMESAYEIDFQAYFDQGYRGVIFDIDNTLVPHDAAVTDKVISLVEQLKEIGFSICLLSNNKEPRVAAFNAPLLVHYIFKADKPSRKGYQKAMAKMHTDVSNTLFVGDQLFTDIWGAKRTGIYSILVKPIHPKEEIQIVLKRCIEKPVLWFYHRKLKGQEK